ncbi:MULTISPECIES: hypothetical protein [Bacillus cereus group]|nr:MULTISPECIES: hypothetical protein [Bacillus cereus group]
MVDITDGDVCIKVPYDDVKTLPDYRMIIYHDLTGFYTFHVSM